MEDLMYDFLPGTDTYYYQHPKLFRTNTDTALLGQFMRIRKSDTVLDIGTNNGALLLYAKDHQPKAMIGVDINADALAIAQKNMKLHQIENVKLYHGNILDMTFHHVSCIVCNPPYFKVHDEKKLNDNLALSWARHEVHLPLEKLCQACSRILQDRGRLYMVHRADRFLDLCYCMRMHHLEIKKIQFVYDENKEDARSVLIEAMKNGKAHCHICKPIYLTRDKQKQKIEETMDSLSTL